MNLTQPIGTLMIRSLHKPASILFVLTTAISVTMLGCSDSSQIGGTEETQDIHENIQTAKAPGTRSLEQNGHRGTESQNSESQVAVDDELPSLTNVIEKPRDVEPVDNNEPEIAPEVQTINIPDSWRRLSDKHEIWVSFRDKKVIAAGNICMQAGPLEVFACPRHTKEHESVISVNALASEIHGALLAIGAEPGEPVQWHEEYKAASGPVIKIDVIWKDIQGNTVRRTAQELVRNIKTGKTMEQDWVFGGSQEFKDEESGQTFYYGDGGELVCLSNFSTATMDVPIQSSDANEGLLFEANTPNIPEIGTKVYLVFKPVLKTKQATKDESSSR